MTSVSIADFHRDVLSPWFSDGDDSWRSNRKTFTSAMDVAAHALWWGLTQSDGKRGRVHILTDDAAKAKEARDYLDAFAERSLLKGQVKKVASDGLMTLRNGVTIEVTSNVAKRPTDILHGILLTAGPETNVEVTPQELARAVIDAAHGNATFAKHITSLLGLESNWFPDFWKQRIKEAKAAVRKQEVKAPRREPKSEPLPAASAPPPLDVGVGADGYYTAAYEEINAQRKMDCALDGDGRDGRPRVLRRRPDDRPARGWVGSTRASIL